MNNMLKILEVKIQIDFKSNERSTKSLNMIMNELLLSYVDIDYRDMISSQIIKPYAQSIVFSKEENLYIWKIASLDTQATENILYVLRDKLSEEVFLKQYDIVLRVQAKNYIHSTTYRQLVEKYFVTDCRCRKIDLKFVTPTIFYSNDEYAVLPQLTNLLENLICIWNLFAGENVLQEQNLSSNLAKQIYVIDYDFNIKPIVDEDNKMPALTGIYSLGLRNNIMAKKIICMLAEFAQYCGIGKKTDLGWGNVKSTIFRNNKI